MSRCDHDSDDLLDRCAEAAHEAYRSAPHSKQHAPEDCPCRDGHDDNHGLCERCERLTPGPAGCHACRPNLRAWAALTEAAREGYRDQVKPAWTVLCAALAEAHAERKRLRVAAREALAALDALLRHHSGARQGAHDAGPTERAARARDALRAALAYKEGEPKKEPTR